jgi:hypothetical protein
MGQYSNPVGTCSEPALAVMLDDRTGWGVHTGGGLWSWQWRTSVRSALFGLPSGSLATVTRLADLEAVDFGAVGSIRTAVLLVIAAAGFSAGNGSTQQDVVK